MTDENAYILGTDDEELVRLRVQHKAWIQEAHALWRRAGLRSGQRVLDLGCGPGFTALELAHVVGPDGCVVARDASARFLAFLGAERDRTGAPVEPSLGAVEELDFAAESFDAAYARWLFCWLPDPVTAVRRVAETLRVGAALLIQDYLNWASMKLVPREAVFDRVVDACMQSWHAGGGHIDVCDLIPEMARGADLAVEHFAPVARLGPVGSLEWRWLGGFYATYLPRLVERGQLDAATQAEFIALWEHRTATGEGFVVAPTVADVILRKRWRK